MQEEFKNINSGKTELKEFGVTIGAILIALADIAMLRGKAVFPYLLTAGILFTGLGMLLPAVLRLPQKIWMALAIVIGFFMSRLILTVLFYGVITPMGLLMRALGKDVLDQRISKEASSYWHKRPAALKDKASYENQY